VLRGEEENFDLGTFQVVGSGEVLALGGFVESTDHGRQDRVDVLRSRVSALLKPPREILPRTPGQRLIVPSR